MTARWRLEQVAGPAAELHASSVGLLHAQPPVRTARVLFADTPALVLGSHQPEGWFDRSALDRSGLALARRRSGGGAVMVGPGQCVWVDFVVPAGDPLWQDDIGRAAWWVGEWWCEVISAAGLAPGAELAVWRAAMRTSRWSPLVCFAGLGPGEVQFDGSKVVGVSQRRTRRAALFQTAALLAWEPEAWPRLLSDEGRAALGSGAGSAADLAGAAAGLGAAHEQAVVAAVVERLMP